jgi:outer membrane protein assembly factor BamB
MLSDSKLFRRGCRGDGVPLPEREGKILWKTPFPGSLPSLYIWSSPTFYNGSIYIGSASFGDCPLIQGQLLQLDAISGRLIHQFDTVPNGCTGGGVWSTPTIDEAAGTVYTTTGNPSKCTGANIYSPAMVELDAADVIHLLGYWQVPKKQQNSDSDFGTTATLRSAQQPPSSIHQL